MNLAIIRIAIWAINFASFEWSSFSGGGQMEHYNEKRPHEALENSRPIDFLKKYEKKENENNLIRIT